MLTKLSKVESTAKVKTVFFSFTKGEHSPKATKASIELTHISSKVFSMYSRYQNVK